MKKITITEKQKALIKELSLQNKSINYMVDKLNVPRQVIVRSIKELGLDYDFSGKSRKSQSVSLGWENRQREVSYRYDLVCLNCKRDFRSTVRELKYCSRDCYYKGRPKGHNEDNQVCIGCGVSFISYNSNKRKYCSKKCFYNCTWEERTERALEIRGNGYSHWTWYNGIHFRSTWEARVAKTLDENNILWEYEQYRVDLNTGVLYNKKQQKKILKSRKVWTYLPDFYLPEFNIWLEVKGWWRGPDLEKVKRFKELGYHLTTVEEVDMKEVVLL